MFESFLKFEEENNLYDNVKDWQLYRKTIYYAFTKNVSSTKNPLNYSTLFGFFNSFFWILPFPILKETLYIGHPRFIQNNWFDENFSNLTNNNIDFKYIDQSKQANLKNFLYRKTPFSIFKVISLILSRFLTPPNYLKKLKEISSKKLGNNISTELLYSMKLYNDLVYQYLNILFKFSNCKKVFFVRSDNYIAIIKAAKKNNILTYEFQHGDIVKEEVSINHPKSKINYVYYPDNLLVYSKLWVENLSVFSKIIEIGKYKTRNSSNGRKRIIVVLEIFNRDEQILFCKRLIKIITKNNIINCELLIKVHPSTSQVDFYNNLNNLFKDLSFVKVIYNEMSFEKVINKDTLVIGKYSTALFYSSDVGIKTFVVKSKIRNFLFKSKNISIFDSYDEVLKFIDENFSNIIKTLNAVNSKPKYFKNLNFDELIRDFYNL